MHFLVFLSKIYRKLLIAPLILLLRRNKLHQRIPHEKIRHPALLQLVFTTNTLVIMSKNVLTPPGKMTKKYEKRYKN